MRLRRAILRWTCTICLALVLAAYVFTVRCFAIVGWGNDDNRSIQLAHGCIAARWELGPALGDPWWQCRVRKRPFEWGFQYDRLPWRPRGYQLAIPLWFPVILLALPTAVMWRHHLRTRKIANPCPSCGYSLAGHSPGSPCPECGAAAKPDSSPS